MISDHFDINGSTNTTVIKWVESCSLGWDSDFCPMKSEVFFLGKFFEEIKVCKGSSKKDVQAGISLSS